MYESEERGLAAVTHILGLIAGFLGPLIVYLVKEEEGLVKDQAREALNFQITIIIAMIVSGILVLAFIGILFIFIVGLADLILSIMAAVAASRGERYRYPVSIRFIPSPPSPASPTS